MSTRLDNFLANAASEIRYFKAVSFVPGFAGMTHRVLAARLAGGTLASNVICVARGGLMTMAGELHDGQPPLSDPLSTDEPSAPPQMISPAEQYAECHGIILDATGANAGATSAELFALYSALRAAPFTASVELTSLGGPSKTLADFPSFAAVAKEHPALAKLFALNIQDALWNDAVVIP